MQFVESTQRADVREAIGALGILGAKCRPQNERQDVNLCIHGASWSCAIQQQSSKTQESEPEAI